MTPAPYILERESRLKAKVGQIDGVCSVDFEIKRVHEQSLQQAIELFTHLSSYKQSSDIDGVKNLCKSPAGARNTKSFYSPICLL